MELPATETVPRIIVADDREQIRRLVVEVITQTLPNAAVIETRDGSQAYRACQHGGCHLLLTNHNMPGMDGLTLIRQVRRHTMSLPIWIFANESEIERVALAAGATGFLRNEAITTDLSALLRQHVAQGDRVRPILQPPTTSAAGGTGAG